MIVGVPGERFPGERRVALAPAHVSSLVKADLSVIVERGAGLASGFPDSLYEDRGARIVNDVYAESDVVLTVRSGAAAGDTDPPAYRAGQTILGYHEPYGRTRRSRR